MSFLRKCSMLWQNYTVNILVITIIVLIISLIFSIIILYKTRCRIKICENQNNYMRNSNINNNDLDSNERKETKLKTFDEILLIIIGIILTSSLPTLIGAFVKFCVNTSEDSNIPQEITSYISTSTEYEQKLNVSATGSYAKLTLYEWYNDWVPIWSADGCVGSAGIGNAKEGSSITPSGTFKIGFAYGVSNKEDIETNLNYIKLSENSVWVDDENSPFYNVLTDLNSIGNAHYEPTYQQFTTDGKYSTNIYFENNGDGLTPGKAESGKGSVITLCGCRWELKPTAGCIDISSADMTELLKYLDSEKNPVIIIS